MQRKNGPLRRNTLLGPLDKEAAMKTTSRTWLTSAASLTAMVLGAVGTQALAQSAPAAGDKVTGTQLQAWLSGNFSYAGVNKASQCVILNVSQGAGRTLFVRCPNGWAEKLSGTARVVGDTYCTSFPIPNSPAGEDCVTWHSLGQWKFEQRKGNAVDTTVIVLPEGLNSAK
jgi:hypothetical protein